MLRHERRVLGYCLAVGVALTSLVIAADGAGLLTPFENYLYDKRALTCQFFMPPPSDKLVHLDIDDPALDVIGRWPWPRAKVAQILEELSLAGPKAIEMDVLMSEPQEIQYLPIGTTQQTGVAATQPTTQPCVPFDNDAELARVIAKLNNVIVPVALEPIPRQSNQYKAMVRAFEKDLEQEEPALRAKIASEGLADREKDLGDIFFVARREAILNRLSILKLPPETPFSEVKSRLLPHTPAEVNTGVANVVREEWEQFLAVREFRRFSVPPPPGISRFAPMRVQIAPVRALSHAAAGGAFVNYFQFGSPVIRTLPLLLEADGRFYPQMGLALACRMLDADITRMSVSNAIVSVPRQSGANLVIPLSPARYTTDGFYFGNLFDIPWFGGTKWETMYDWPKHERPQQHIPFNEIWQACIAQQKIERNNHGMDDAIRGILDVFKDQQRIDHYNQSMPSAGDFETRAAFARKLAEEFLPYKDAYKGMKPEEMKFDDQVFVASFDSLQQMLLLTPPIQEELRARRASMKQKLAGKAVLVGWAATSSITDFVPTSLHEKAPGPVVHGVVFSGIMTGELWTRWPWSVAAAAAALMGVMTALAVGYLPPMRALFVALGLFLLYALVNGVVLFDLGNRIVGAAGPFTAIGVVWGGCTLTRVMVEATERRRITRAFSTQVDSKLVDYLLETGQDSFPGENREVTVVFTDFANFTALSEKMGEKIVLVLNQLLGELVPVIREAHQGYVNKFLGDGIMFFYNAPKLIRDHATDAVATVLDMQVKLKEFNVRLRERGLPELAMRGGIASGVVVVGDAGYVDRGEYTCLGDAVNLSSRLEGANKITGTHTLINDRAAELMEGQFLVRPIGRIQAVGKSAAIMCFEPIVRATEASDEQRKLVEMTTRMVDAFIARQFESSTAIAFEIDAAFGESKLTILYRSMCKRYLSEPPGDDFDGRIVLTEK